MVYKGTAINHHIELVIGSDQRFLLWALISTLDRKIAPEFGYFLDTTIVSGSVAGVHQTKPVRTFFFIVALHFPVLLTCTLCGRSERDRRGNLSSQEHTRKVQMRARGIVVHVGFIPFSSR